MTQLQVKSFPHARVSDDGTSITIDVELSDGASHQLVMPYSQLDWLTQVLFSAGQGAYQKQAQSGRLSAANPVDAAMIAEGFRVLPNAAKKEALIQMTGRSQPNEPLGMGSVLVGEELLRNLSVRLSEALQQLAPKH